MNKFRWLTLLMWMVFSTGAVSAQQTESDTIITLERTACFGTCPVYTVNILEDGTVIYEGTEFVSVTGKQTGEISPEAVVWMVAAFNDAGYFDWKEAYETQTVRDLPTVITSVMSSDTLHRITHYTGDSTAPLVLSYLEYWIDEMTNTVLWTGVQPDISGISNGTNTPLITLQQGPNFGSGPVFQVAGYEDGTVVYTGIANVNEIGVRSFQTDPTVIASIAQTAEITGYFNWRDSYEEPIITDQATVITSIRWADQFKRIVRAAGDPNVPIGVVRIEASIDRLVTDLIGCFAGQQLSFLKYTIAPGHSAPLRPQSLRARAELLFLPRSTL